MVHGQFDMFYKQMYRGQAKSKDSGCNCGLTIYTKQCIRYFENYKGYKIMFLEFNWFLTFSFVHWPIWFTLLNYCFE